VAHDGKDVFFLIQVPGAYVYKSDSEKDMASVALIFGVGDDATYHNVCMSNHNCFILHACYVVMPHIQC
jgi:hypothetical protein